MYDAAIDSGIQITHARRSPTPMAMYEYGAANRGGPPTGCANAVRLATRNPPRSNASGEGMRSDEKHRCRGIGLAAARHAIHIYCRDGEVAAIPFPMDLAGVLSPDRAAEEKAP